jgi:hypothetical protein
MLYTYYVFSSEEAPERPFGDPFVKYHSMVAHSTTSQPDTSFKDYVGVQLSLMKYEDFWTLIDPKHFCCGRAEVEKGLCKAVDQLLVKKAPGQRYRDVEVYQQVVRFPDGPSFEPTDVKLRVRETGVYILMISNCGLKQGASITGNVQVKNAYGFLPGNEYHKMPFYGFLSFVYLVFAIIWGVLSYRWWKEVFAIQNCIAGVIVLGAVEAFIWYIFFWDWNSSGSRRNVLFVFAILTSVAKSIFSYMLVLVAALGWGITRPYLDKDIMLRIKAVVVLYIVLGVAREAVLSFMHSHSLPLSFVLLCLLPVSLLNGVIFYWVFTALSSLIQSLKDRGQTAKLQLFQRLWSILIVSLGVASVTLLYQIFSFSRSLVSQWMHQWLFTDGVSHILFLVVLVAMMYLWAPHQNSNRYAFSSTDTKEPDNEDGKPANAADSWIDEGGEDDEDDDSFWSSTRAAPATSGTTGEVIGATPAATSVLKNTMAELDKLGVEEGAPAEKMS